MYVLGPSGPLFTNVFYMHTKKLQLSKKGIETIENKNKHRNIVVEVR